MADIPEKDKDLLLQLRGRIARAVEMEIIGFGETFYAPHMHIDFVIDEDRKLEVALEIKPRTGY